MKKVYDTSYDRGAPTIKFSDESIFDLGVLAISHNTVGFRQLNTALFDWTFFRPESNGHSCRQSSPFYSFCDLPRGGWCRGGTVVQQSKSVGSSVLGASPRATARRILVPESWWLLCVAESRKSYVREVALTREPLKLQQAQPLLVAWDIPRAAAVV